MRTFYSGRLSKRTIRLLERMLALLERQHHKGLGDDRKFLMMVAESKPFRAAVESALQDVPLDAHFDSFEDLRRRRDATGFVRLTHQCQGGPMDSTADITRPKEPGST